MVDWKPYVGLCVYRYSKVNADLLYRNYAIFTELRHDIAYNFEVVSMNMDGASDVSIIYVPSETDKTSKCSRQPGW